MPKNITAKITSRPKRIDLMILGIILLLGLTLRLYKIDSPIADWHSWRQADTAAVARNFVKNDFNLLSPRYDDLSNIQTTNFNPQGYRLVEFPLYNGMFAFAYKYLPIMSLEIYGRLTTIIFSLIVIAAIYFLVLGEEGRLAAGIASGVFAVFPFFVYYSRVILPEMTALGFMMLAILSLYLWKNASTKIRSGMLFLLSATFCSLALLIKPTVIFYGLPLLYIFFQKFKLSMVKKLPIYIYFAIAIIPFVLWRQWISHYPEGMPTYEWLLTSVNTFEGTKVIFFRPAFFRWIFHERILNMILGGYAATLLILGVLKRPNRSYLLPMFGLAALIYLFTFQGGNVQHDYYQTMILPPLAIFVGLGSAFILQQKKLFHNVYLSTIAVVVILGFSAAMSFYQVKGFYHVSDDLVSIAKVIRTITPPDAHIVTDRDGDTTLLYLADRKGYPAVTEDLAGLKTKGMQYLVTAKADVADKVKLEYEMIFANDQVFIFKL